MFDMYKSIDSSYVIIFERIYITDVTIMSYVYLLSDLVTLKHIKCRRTYLANIFLVYLF